MKIQKRIIALVLFAVMLFSFAACSKNDPTPSTDNTTAPSTTPAGDATTPSTDASTSDWAGPDWMNQTGMPIVKEGTEKTLSIYVEQTAEYGDFKESWMYKYITEVMNINLDVTVFLSDSKADFLSLAFASNELPDIIIGSGFSTTELVNYGAVEGQLLDLNEYINDTYMPNLSGIFASNPNLKNQVMTPDGHIWGLGGISASRGSMPRYFMNYDYLEQLNIAVPTTLDEFIDAEDRKITGRLEQINAARDSYYPRGIYDTNPGLHRAIDTLVDGTVPTDDDQRELYHALLDGASWHRADHYFLLMDYASYLETKLRANKDYADRMAFGRKCLVNVASGAKFSSDRTIRQYANEIWHIEPTRERF